MPLRTCWGVEGATNASWSCQWWPQWLQAGEPQGRPRVTWGWVGWVFWIGRALEELTMRGQECSTARLSLLPELEALVGSGAKGLGSLEMSTCRI